MPGRELVVLEWVQKAENDLKTAVHTLKLGRECPTDTVCFHAQQCVEKYLKAYLASRGITFPRTHDVGEIMPLLPGRISVRLTPDEKRRLTSYATVTRYPGGYEPISLKEARAAVALARRVRAALQKILPK